jgi:hypothetical protein
MKLDRNLVRFLLIVDDCTHVSHIIVLAQRPLPDTNANEWHDGFPPNDLVSLFARIYME